MSAFGFTPADYAAETVEVWPENWPAVRLFNRLGTQWRIGMIGATGLDYTAAYPLMDRLNLPADEWDDLLSDLQTLESAALNVMNEK